MPLFRISSSSGTIRTAGPGFLIPFALAWIAFSSFFVYLGWNEFSSKGERAMWHEVPCVIDQFEILDDPKEDEPYSVAVVFRYFHQGTERTGTRASEKETRHENFHKLMEKRAKIMAKPEATCLVNRDNPDDAYLAMDGHSRLGSLIPAVFGLAFVAIGIGMLMLGIQSVRTARRAGKGMLPVTERTPDQNAPAWILVPFFSIFALAGLGIFFGLVVPSWMLVLRSKTWVEVPGDVIWSKVMASSSSDSTTYRPLIFYRYEFNGREYRSDRDSFFELNSSGREGKAKIVAAHPPGKAVKVWVDPESPWHATLNRSVGARAWFSLFPLPFMAIGIGGLIYLIRRKNPKAITAHATGQARTTAARMPGFQAVPEPVAGESLILKPGKGRWLKFLGMTLIALFWNGIVSVFFFHVSGEWRGGQSPWGLTLFLVPFVLVGIALVAAMVHQLGAVFNPRPILRVHPGVIRIGHSLSVSWEIPSGAGRLRDLKIVLRGEEVATYRRGTNTSTVRSTFFESEIARAEQAQTIAMGRGGITLPDNLMPTWTASNNRIEWTLELQGSIALWPDIKDSHTVIVRATS